MRCRACGGEPTATAGGPGKKRSSAAKPSRRYHQIGDRAMVLIQLLLPTAGSVDSEETEPLDITRRELAARFKGLTAYLRSPAKGVWTAPDGHTESDDVVMVEVVTETFDRPWWRSYVALLARRFGQETIHVRALSIETPNEEPI